MSEVRSYDQVFKALALAQGEMTTPPKDRTAKIPMKAGGSYSYKYADLATIIETVKKVLAKNGLCVSQTIDMSEHGHTLTTMLGHSSGQYIESKCNIPMADDVKSWGGNITYVRRYALTAILGISTDEDTDSAPQQERERGSAFVGSPNLASEGAPHSTTALVSPQSMSAAVWSPSEKQLARLFAITNASGYTSEDAKGLLKQQYGIESSKKMTKVIYDEFIKWLQDNPKPNVNPDSEPSEGDFTHG